MNLLERIYLYFYLQKKRKLLQSQKRLPLPVISVGNLTVGGTGKTPFTVALAKEAIKRGYIPIILTRGYRGKLKGPLVVLSKDNPKDVGDEPLMMALEGLTVVKSIDRYSGGIFAIKEFGLKVRDNAFFILDDGFQHRRLWRDINILLLDGSNFNLRCRLLPLGPLRSPIDEIEEAHLVFITKEENQELSLYLSNFTSPEHFFAPFKIEGLFNEKGELIELSRKSAFAFAGIGNFEFFLKMLRSLHLRISGYKQYRDHKNYQKGDVLSILRQAKEAELIITTKKDFVKLREYLELFKGRLYYLEVTLSIDERGLEQIFSMLDWAFSQLSLMPPQ